MNKLYTLTFLSILACSLTASAQSEINKQQVVIPITSQSTDNITSDYLPVFAGSQYNIEASFTAPAKKTTLSKVLKAAGLATATFQTAQNIPLGKGQAAIGKPNWLIPVGLGVALGADNLLPQKRATAFIQYSFYDKNMSLLETKLEPIISGKKPVSFNGIATTDGFLKVAFINSNLSPVSNGNIGVSIEWPHDYYDFPVVRKPVDLQLLLPEQREITVPEIIPHLLPYNIAAESTEIVPSLPVKSVYHNQPIAIIENNDDNLETPLSIRKGGINTPVYVKGNLPKPVLPEVPTFPFPFLFPIEGLLPPKRFIIDDGSDEEPEPEPIDDGGFYSVFDDSYSHSLSYVDPCIENPYADGCDPCQNDDSMECYCQENPDDFDCYCQENPDDLECQCLNNPDDLACYCVDNPEELECQCLDNPDDSQCYCLFNPTDELCSCESNPDDEACCDNTKEGSPCYIPCPTNSPDPSNIPNGAIQVDPEAFANKLKQLGIPSDATDINIYLTATTDAFGNTTYKLSGSYSDPNDPFGSVTVISPFQIGTIESYGSAINDILADSSYQPLGNPIQYSGGIVQNYINSNGKYYSSYTPVTGPVTIFPGATITPELGGSDPGNAWTEYNGTIHANTGDDLATLEHEYGHYLQFEVFGLDFFQNMANDSLMNAILDAKMGTNDHHCFWTETGANALSSGYFGPNSDIANSTWFVTTKC